MRDDGFAKQVLMCWPTDRQAIARLNKQLHPEQQFAPTIEHSLSTCDGCTCDVWIGPQQRELAGSVLVAARVLCILCTKAVQSVLDMKSRQIDLNPGLHYARRRV